MFQEFFYQSCYLGVMTFESKVSAWNKVSFSVRLIALEGIGTSRNE